MYSRVVKETAVRERRIIVEQEVYSRKVVSSEGKRGRQLCSGDHQAPHSHQSKSPPPVITRTGPWWRGGGGVGGVEWSWVGVGWSGMEWG